MSWIVLCIVAVALCWGGWPLVARLAGDTGLSGSVILSAVTFVSVVVAALLTGASMPPARAAGALVVAGVMMGVGLIAFYAVSSHPQVELSTAIPVMDTSMLLVAVIGGIWFFGEAVTARKLVGIALLVAGIIVLRPDR